MRENLKTEAGLFQAEMFAKSRRQQVQLNRVAHTCNRTAQEGEAGEGLDYQVLSKVWSQKRRGKTLMQALTLLYRQSGLTRLRGFANTFIFP